jgi:hypothetical protein
MPEGEEQERAAEPQAASESPQPAAAEPQPAPAMPQPDIVELTREQLEDLRRKLQKRFH